MNDRRTTIDDATLEGLVRWVAEIDAASEESTGEIPDRIPVRVLSDFPGDNAHDYLDFAPGYRPVPETASSLGGSNAPGSGDSTGGSTRRSRPQRSLRGTLAPIATLAAALLLAFILVPTNPAGDEAPPAMVAPGEPAELPLLAAGSTQSARVSIRYLPNDASTGTRVSRFSVIAESQCVVLALVRTWEEDCDCLEWRVYEWQEPGGDGVIHELQQPGEWIDIEVEVGNRPEVEQTLLVITAERREDLPMNAQERDQFLACVQESLNGEFLPERAIASVPRCLPCESSGTDLAIVVHRP